MEVSLVSSDGRASLTLSAVGKGVSVLIRSQCFVGSDDENEMQISFLLPNPQHEVVEGLRRFLIEVRDDILEGTSRDIAGQLCDERFRVAIDKDCALLKMADKRWCQIVVDLEPRSNCRTYFLMDATIIDQFLEASYPH